MKRKHIVSFFQKQHIVLYNKVFDTVGHFIKIRQAVQCLLADEIYFLEIVKMALTDDGV